jgi:hypothetical protein
LTALIVLVALAGGLIGLNLAGPADYETRLGEASFSVGLAEHGQVNVALPHADRTVGANVFDAPVALRVQPRKLDGRALIRAASGRGSELRAISTDVEQVATRSLKRAWLWLTLGALALGAAFAVLAFWRSAAPRLAILALALGPGACAAFAGGLCLHQVDATFDAAEFQRPGYYRSLADPAELASALLSDPRALAGEAPDVGP